VQAVAGVLRRSFGTPPKGTLWENDVWGVGYAADFFGKTILKNRLHRRRGSVDACNVAISIG